MNKVVLIGRLTKDPELKFTPGEGKAVCRFSLAVNRNFKNKDNKTEADFIPIVTWGKTAELVANYLSKGRNIGVSGRIQTRSYDDKDGTKRYITEIVAEEVQFLDNPSKSDQGENQILNEEYQDGNYEPIDDGGIPF